MADALKRRLDPGIDPSTTARAVYGWRFGNLLYLDAGWVAGHLAEMFPNAPEASALRETCWENYLAVNPVSSHTWLLLEGEYRRAVESLASGRVRQVRMSLGADPIVQHVMRLYWHGIQGLDEGSIVARFFETAPEELRHEALDYIGRCLEPSNDDEIPDDVIARLKELWRRRLAAGVANPSSHAKELSAFGWWAKAGRLDLEWRFEQLRKRPGAGGPGRPGIHRDGNARWRRRSRIRTRR